MNYSSARKYTNQILEDIDNGLFDPYSVLKSCLTYMSEQEVEDMLISEGYYEVENDEE
jgi:hypothetical protein